MFGLKGAYFYLVAIQITFIKFFKKIYFLSNRYNNSLMSKIPTQVYFNPNSFLLSLISPYKKKSFRINETQLEDFESRGYKQVNKEKSKSNKKEKTWQPITEKKV